MFHKTREVAQKYGRKIGQKVAVGSAMLLPAFAFAADGDIDVSDAVASIGAAKVSVLLICGSVFSLYLGMKIYKWARAALS